MPLTLRAIALNDSPLSQPITASFDERGGSIGRADTNTLALPDPERHISRVQVELSWRGGSALVTNVGGPNPVLVNGRLLEQGASATLVPGGHLQIGGYRLLIEGAAPADTPGARSGSVDFSTGFGLGAAPAGDDPFAILGRSSSSAPPPGARAPTPTPTPTPSAGRGRTVSSGGPKAAPAAPRAPDRAAPASAAASPADDPFAALGSDFSPGPAGVLPGSAALKGPAAPAASPADLPDPFASVAVPGTDDVFDLDNWATPGGTARSPQPAPARPSAAGQGRRQETGMTWLGDMAGPAPAGSGIDHLIDPPPGGSERDPLDEFLSEGPRTPAPRARTPIDERVEPWDEPMPQPVARKADAAGRAPVPAAAPLPDPAPKAARSSAAAKLTPAAPPHVPTQRLPARPRASSSAEPPPAAARPAAPAASAAGPADAAALWQAFCEGAGIDGLASETLTPQRMGELGALMRASVDGVHALVMMRARSKEEMGSAVTQIRSSANNPLKFSVDGHAALEQVLRPPLRGFMAGPTAMREACDDVLAHAIGTVAGMQAALRGVLDRFEPAALEGKLSSRSVLDAVLPAARKARLWELYVQHAAVLREEASEDFDALYGKAFRKAYDAQIDRLHDER